MRDTKYATEQATGVLPLPSGSEARVERLFIKAKGEVEIRFSWWKDQRMMERPLDLSESDLLKLLREGIKQQVFSQDFLRDLKQLLP